MTSLLTKIKAIEDDNRLVASERFAMIVALLKSHEETPEWVKTAIGDEFPLMDCNKKELFEKIESAHEKVMNKIRDTEHESNNHYGFSFVSGLDEGLPEQTT